MSSTASPMALIDVFVAPKSLFEQLKAAKKWSWLALALMMTITSLSVMSFYDNMSPEWIVEQQLELAGDMSAAERESATKIIQQTAGNVGIIGASVAAIMTLLLTAIYAIYFMGVGKLGGINKQKLSYGDWFSFSVWIQMPMLINTIGFAVLFLTASTADLPLNLGNYASLNQLVTGYLPTDALFSWAETLNLFFVWNIALVSIGLKKCSDMSTVKATTLAAMPYIAIFGLWFVLA